jgi:hypothetical protein
MGNTVGTKGQVVIDQQIRDALGSGRCRRRSGTR